MLKSIELKSDPEIFEKHWNNKKNFDMRKIHDHIFQDGDILLLREFDQETQSYSGREILARVLWVLRGPAYSGLNEGNVIMSLHPVTIKTKRDLEPEMK